ncbi:hypothetical protein KXJ69_11150 [Aureisphaera sp. CAU 1614]|uniref:Uncharacterized protein n=1 Tax=Halomarinibacterium sedimenti TaxID=2857106 RepID=A0A9X1FRT3_9FLAO|nr:hypothetical protein [Halomarinibacterium sedimenti]MBW2938667.1 hypothetical protein [Halomarinibacterium sedimenti]
MNSKWYLSILVIALAFFGKSLEQKQAPNQEILVQFNEDFVSTSETEAAVETVKKQLQSIGVNEIQVVTIQDGSIKITYYSAIDVSFVEVLFKNQENLYLAYAGGQEKSDSSSSFPSSENDNYIHLNVNEIPDNSNRDIGFSGVLVEVKFVRDQFENPIAYFGTSEKDFTLKKYSEVLNKNLYFDGTIIKENTSYKIPEVRAGPLS